mmetsp:Transcript_19752/g.58766  ORF Transcript_19752/g.58766 Transcript_19752/m.58766 type:complete len:125 (+) Transcript_19752:1331-1705(+)
MNELDPREDLAVVNAFETALSHYPHGWDGGGVVDGVGDDDAETVAPEPASTQPTGLAPPPPAGFVLPPAPPGASPATLPAPPHSGDTYGDMLKSWYFAGYYAGLHEQRQRNAAAAATSGGSPSG